MTVVTSTNQAQAEPARIADSDAAGDAGAAAAIAAEFEHPVIISPDTTETSQTVALPDGSLQLDESTQPTRVQQADGSWAPLDLTLVRDDGTNLISPREASTPVDFSAGGVGPLARVQAASGAWLTLAPPAALTMPAPSLAGSTATYTDVLPGVDLDLIATPEGMSEVLAIKTAAAAANPALDSLRFAVGGASLGASAGGAVQATVGGVQSDLVAPAPTWWDSSDQGTAAGPGGDSLPMPVPTSVSASAVTIDAGAPADTHPIDYPLFVDPGWGARTQQSRTFVDNAYPDTSYWNGAGASDGYQHVGYIDAANSDDGNPHATRSFWQYDVHEIAGTHVSAANFTLDNVYSESCAGATVHLGLTTGINSSTSWRYQPTVRYWVDDETFAQGRSGCPYNPANPVGFNAVGAAKIAASESLGQMTLTLQADESQISGWKKFSANAHLTVNYTVKPGTPRVWDNTCTRTPGLINGDRLLAGQVRYSNNNQYRLIMQTDGNLVLYGPTKALWQSGTPDIGYGAYAVMQGDRNLVVRDSSGRAQWNSGTAISQSGNTPIDNSTMLAVQDDANLVVYDAESTGLPAWQSHTGVSVGSAAAIYCYDRSTNPLIGALGTNGNGTNQYYKFSKNGTEFWSSSGGPTASSTARAVGAGNLAEGTYLFRAQICVTAADKTEVCGNYSPPIAVVIDRTPPSPPSVTTANDQGSVLAGGVVGQRSTQVTITSSNSSSDHLQGIVYTQYPFQTSARSAVQVTNPGCGYSQVGYTVVCTGGADIDHTVIVAASAEQSSIQVVAFDMAGNVASQSSSAVTFKVDPDWASVNAGDSWSTASAPTGTCPQTQVPDTATSGGVSLTLTGGACWAPIAGGGPHSVPLWPVKPVDALTFDSAGTGQAQTPTPMVNTTASFSAGAWVYAADTTGTSVALAQNTTSGSAFAVKLVSGVFQFCVSTACVTSANTATANSWHFVVAVYDSINQQARLYDSTDGDYAVAATADIGMAPASSSGLLVGSDGGTTPNWHGQILNPFAVQGVLSAKPIGLIGAAGCSPHNANTAACPT